MCDVNGCGQAPYEGIKCIFHCDKTNWFKEVDNGKKDWSEGLSKSQSFWATLRSFLNNSPANFSEFIFPKFEQWGKGDSNFFLGHNQNRSLKGVAQFSKSIFLDDADFENVHFPHGVLFEGSVFQGNAKFSGGRLAGAVNYDHVECHGSLEFANSHFTTGSAVSFKNVQVSGNLLFSQVRFEGSATFTKSEFNAESKFLDTGFAGPAIFSQIVFRGNSLFKNVQFSQVDFSASAFSEVYFEGVSLGHNANFSKTIFNQHLTFSGASSASAVSFSEATFYSGVSVSGGNFGGGTFSRARFIQRKGEGISEVRLKAATFNRELDLEGVQSQAVIIFDSIKVGLSMKIKNSDFVKVSFINLDINDRQTGEGCVGALTFEDVGLDELVMEGVVNNKELLPLKNIVVRKELRIAQSDLGKMKLVNFNVVGAKRIIFDEVSFWNVIFVNVKWDDITRIEGTRDVFRQLKTVNEAQGNHIEASLFHSMEMKKYLDEDLWKWPNSFAVFGDQLAFWLNWLISKNTASWIRPLVLLGLFGVGFYEWALYALDGDSINRHFQIMSDRGAIKQKIFPYLNNLIKFANPFLSTVDDELKGRLSRVYGIWFLHKVCSVALLYHFIAALRRKTRMV